MFRVPDLHLAPMCAATHTAASPLSDAAPPSTVAPPAVEGILLERARGGVGDSDSRSGRGQPKSGGGAELDVTTGALSPCGFCKGGPVGNAASWVDGKPRPPAPCPRCGETYQDATGAGAEQSARSAGAMTPAAPADMAVSTPESVMDRRADLELEFGRGELDLGEPDNDADRPF